AFHSLTVGQLLHALSCRSETHRVFQGNGLPANPYLAIAVGGSLALQGLAAFVPGLRAFLGLTPLGLADVAVIGGSALLSLFANEATKGRGRL
ncbi:MAG: cation transporting ATPase C-terminal domain-containing protein, partial [Deltaproteobacteria bacterium]|nr:cation transporting ATPase C-terminal domain-containing protein [Deltaproteobacteria bacterium]